MTDRIMAGDIAIYLGDAPPTSGVTLVGEAVPGSLYVDRTAGGIYLASFARSALQWRAVGGGLDHQATVTLTNAQIKALATEDNYIEIVPAAGANQLIVPSTAVIITNFGVGYGGVATSASLYVGWPYTPLGGVINLVGVYTDLTGVLADTTAGAFTLLTLGLAKILGGASSLLSVPGYTVNPKPNLPLVIAGTDASPAWTGGDAANTLTVSVLYSVLDVTTGVFS
jgi:hypothetical protein